MQDKVSCGLGSRSPSFFFVISEVHGYGALSWVHYSGGVATSTAMVSDGNAPAAASNAARCPSYAPTPHVDFTGDLLHHAVLDHLLGTVVSLFVAVAALLVGAGVAAIKGLHGRWLGEIVVGKRAPLSWAGCGSASCCRPRWPGYHSGARGCIGTWWRSAAAYGSHPAHLTARPCLTTAPCRGGKTAHSWGDRRPLGSHLCWSPPADGPLLSYGLLHLHQNRNDEQNQNHTSRDAITVPCVFEIWWKSPLDVLSEDGETKSFSQTLKHKEPFKHTLNNQNLVI